MTPEEVRRIVRQEMQQAGAANRFQLSPNNRHIHNGQDAPTLPGTSIDAFQQIPTTPDSVLGINNLGRQTYFYLGQLGVTPVLTLPLAAINGFGVGVNSAFNGGDAPEGTMILFTNGDTLSYLCIKSDASSTGWYKVLLEV